MSEVLMGHASIIEAIKHPSAEGSQLIVPSAILDEYAEALKESGWICCYADRVASGFQHPVGMPARWGNAE